MEYNSLRGIMAKHRIKQSLLADHIGITESAFSQKMNGKRNAFNTDQMLLIQKKVNESSGRYYSLDDIFLP